MSRLEREEDAVRAALDAARPPSVPTELCADAMRRGGRMLRRRVLARRLLWALLVAAAVAFTVWACTAHPWVEPPSETTPPLTGL
ncbi:hypothetical protein GTW43_09755 [Streptomyces sp. SID5785]|uniref:hypothetical protein n=1 Tax=Streptomyces sp. SID5785 TaxID=2690309 RepID=UPI00136166A8|nr:hypothetical protein [Streptomyces sp. SID5785]MZD05364.1 hypothetical protein [Streptomyces sp. SID5785]